MSIDRNVLDEILGQIENGNMILFLGSGSTRLCRKMDGTPGLTGRELADEILKKVNRGRESDLKVSLSKAAEFFVAARPTARIGLDELIQNRLADLQPGLGHYILTVFPWKAIITTNYNLVIEEAYRRANEEGFTTYSIRPVRHDKDLAPLKQEHSELILYKPHGCISLESDVRNRLVITAKDYFDSPGLRPRMYEELNSLVKNSSTLFIGYSMDDYTFKNIYYGAYDQSGSWATRSFNVSPIRNPLLFEWTENSLSKDFNTTAINTSFDAFMVQLLKHLGKKMQPGLKKKLKTMWEETKKQNAPYMDKLSFDMIDNL
ncbi:MAG: SIR2 family protein [Candidatus Odinarchaeota archaeon]